MKFDEFSFRSENIFVMKINASSTFALHKELSGVNLTPLPHFRRQHPNLSPASALRFSAIFLGFPARFLKINLTAYSTWFDCLMEKFGQNWSCFFIERINSHVSCRFSNNFIGLLSIGSHLDDIWPVAPNSAGSFVRLWWKFFAWVACVHLTLWHDSISAQSSEKHKSTEFPPP